MGRPKGRPNTSKVPEVKKQVPVVRQVPAEIISKLVMNGDLSGLTQEQKVLYYNEFCIHLGLDPLTQPFKILNLKGKQVLYADKGGTDQLRKKDGVSITSISGQLVGDIYVVTAIGQNKEGRSDGATGAVDIKGLSGEALANAYMKAETKAKRRLTLSLCGLGMLDESEIDSIPGAATMTLNLTKGEVVTEKPEWTPEVEKPIETKPAEVAKADNLTISNLYKDCLKLIEERTIGQASVNFRKSTEEANRAGDTGRLTAICNTLTNMKQGVLKEAEKVTDVKANPVLTPEEQKPLGGKPTFEFPNKTSDIPKQKLEDTLF
jgi:hypothetical protein